MSVDFIIDQPCVVKETLSMDGMIALIKQRYRAVAAIEGARRNVKSVERVIGATFQIMLAAPGGVQAADVKVSGLLAGTEKLDRLQAYCGYCMASGGKPFGCYRTIGYPISRKAESWLASIARRAVKSKGPRMTPLEFIMEHSIDGGDISKMRADPGGGFFELKRPLDVAAVTGTGTGAGKTVNTDHLLNLALGQRKISEARMEMLLLMQGGLTIGKEKPARGTYQVAFLVPGSDGGSSSWWAYYLRDETTDDVSTQELKEYFRMMALALALRKDMLVSL